MTINITKGESDYVRQSLINGVTLVDEELMIPIDNYLYDVSEKLKNSIVTLNFSESDWEETEDAKVLKITHPYETLDISYKLYRFEDGAYRDELTWSEIISNSEVNIYNDQAITGKIVLVFDISK